MGLLGSVIGGALGSVIPGLGTAAGASIGGGLGEMFGAGKDKKRAERARREAMASAGEFRDIARGEFDRRAPVRDRLQDLVLRFRGDPNNPFSAGVFGQAPGNLSMLASLLGGGRRGGPTGMGTPGFNPDAGFGGVGFSPFGPGNTLAYQQITPPQNRGVSSLMQQFFPQEAAPAPPMSAAAPPATAAPAGLLQRLLSRGGIGGAVMG